MMNMNLEEEEMKEGALLRVGIAADTEKKKMIMINMKTYK